MKHLFFFFVVFFCGVSCLIAQDFKSVIEKVYRTYKNADNLHLRLTITTQKSDNSETDETVELRKRGDRMVYIWGDNEVFYGRTALVWLRHNSQEVFYQQLGAGFHEQQLRFQEEFGLEYIMKRVHSWYNGRVVKLHKREGSRLYYHWSNKFGSHDELVIDTQQYTFHKSLQVKDGGLVVRTLYGDSQLSPTFASSRFSLSHYIVFKGGLALLSRFYSSYRLLTE